MKRREPETIVHQMGVFLGHLLFEAKLVSRKRHLLQGHVGREERRCRRGLVHLAGLYAYEPVLHVVDSPHAVLAGKAVEPLHQSYAAHLLAVQAPGEAPFESDLNIAGLVGGIRG